MELHNEILEIGFPSLAATQKSCFFCGSPENLTAVPFEACKQVFAKRQLCIPEGNRCCKDHIIKERFYEDDLAKFRISSIYSSFKVQDLTKLLRLLAINNSSIFDNIGAKSLPEKQLKVFTGLTWDKLGKLSKMLTSMRSSTKRQVTQALAIFLFKLRAGNSNALISSFFGLNEEQLVSDYSNEVISSFERDVLPLRFGIDAVTRETLLAETSHTARILYRLKDDQLVIICDGSYIRHQTKANKEYQQKSYFGQKQGPLCKPFTICTTNGFVIDTLGPFMADLSDADIMRIVLRNPNGLIKLLKKGDIIVVDRSLLDVKQQLEQLGFVVLMPALKEHSKKLITKDSNESCFVNKIRCVVEAVHGEIKQSFKLLDRKLGSKFSTKTNTLCRIACFLHNEYGTRFDSDVELAKKIVDSMNAQKLLDNTLTLEAESNRWDQRKLPFTTITTENLMTFPELSEKQLQIFFTGAYQLTQAVSYLAELMNKDGTIKLQYDKIQANIIRLQVKSRHISEKSYNCYIEYQPELNEIDGISRYCCDCILGRRTVGCCSHIAAIIYYLSHARYLARIIRPAEILCRLIKDENVTAVINGDSDED